MALEQKMKLQDLKMKVGALNSSRWELLKEQINAAALVIQKMR
ncbi:Uncharacterised protein [Edwardsiella tarda]|nr:Uncharacterised protein [Edwardsiella tarda]